MDFNVILGGLMVVFGIYTLLARKFTPNNLWKLKPMREQWGEKAGLVIHVLAYTVLPLLLGAILLIGGLM